MRASRSTLRSFEWLLVTNLEGRLFPEGVAVSLVEAFFRAFSFLFLNFEEELLPFVTAILLSLNCKLAQIKIYDIVW
jgi:hypothetical protein